jgi:hypothetical protein
MASRWRGHPVEDLRAESAGAEAALAPVSPVDAGAGDTGASADVAGVDPCGSWLRCGSLVRVETASVGLADDPSFPLPVDVGFELGVGVRVGVRVDVGEDVVVVDVSVGVELVGVDVGLVGDEVVSVGLLDVVVVVEVCSRVVEFVSSLDRSVVVLV